LLECMHLRLIWHHWGREAGPFYISKTLAHTFCAKGNNADTMGTVQWQLTFGERHQ